MKLPTPEWADQAGGGAQPPLRRAAEGERAFGYELTLTRQGAIAKALRFFFRSEVPDGLALQQQDALLRAIASCTGASAKRGVAELHYMLAAELRMTPRGGHRAQGSRVFFGVQHEITGEVAPETGKPVRAYVPKGPGTGHESLAYRLGVSVRTAIRWWNILRRFGVWKAWRPPRTAPDALLTKAGTQVYSQRMLVGGTPSCVSRRLPYRHDELKTGQPQTRTSLTASERRAAQGWIDGLEYVPY